VLEIEDRPHVLPVAEMTFVDFPAGKPRLVGYPAKWSPGSFEYEHTVRQFDTAGTTLTERLSGLSLNAWCCFGLRGYARVDFRVDDAGHPWILEVNANPCLSPDAGFAAAVEKTALTATAMIEHIIAAALRAPRLTG
jgi:D-alanine-D-alanine ligase